MNKSENYRKKNGDIYIYELNEKHLRHCQNVHSVLVLYIECTGGNGKFKDAQTRKMRNTKMDLKWISLFSG